MAVGGDNADSSRAQTMQQFVELKTVKHRKPEDRARRRAHGLGIERAHGFLQSQRAEAPKAAALRIIVPRLPGSWSPQATSRSDSGPPELYPNCKAEVPPARRFPGGTGSAPPARTGGQEPATASASAGNRSRSRGKFR